MTAALRPLGDAIPALPRRRGRPRDQDSAETRQRLLRAALGEFACNGYDGTTNRAIAASCGLTTSAIYHYYASKAELYAAVYEAVFQRVFTALERAAVTQQTLIAQFAAAVDAAATLNLEDPMLPAFALGVASEANRHPELNELLRPMRRRNAAFFRRMVRAAAERGELAADVDLRGLEDLLDAVAFGLSRISAVTGDVHRHGAAVATLQRFLSGTLVAGER